MSQGYYRFPTLHQNQITFESEDDLWTVHVQGGIARRLTSNRGEVSKPFYSPDGKYLAFTGREEGNPEIYVMPSIGGSVRRLTYLGAGLTYTVGWNPQGKIIFASNAGHWYLRFTNLYTIDLNGGAPEKINLGMARSISYGSNGGVVIGRNTDEPARWKRYQGGTVGQIWIDESGDGNFVQMTHLKGNLTCPIWLGTPGEAGRIYFISDYEGVGNLYSILPTGGDLKRHTDHQDYYARNASSDGRRIVYHAGADIFLFDPATDHTEKVSIQYYSPRTQRNRKFIFTAEYLQDWSLHPKGGYLAVTSRGKLFRFANWEGAVIQHGKGDDPNVVDHPVTAVRYRLPRWLHDEKRIIAVTDDGGEERLIIFNPQNNGSGEMLSDLNIGRIENIQVNPVKDQIAFSNHRYELMCLDLESEQLTPIDRGKSGPINGFCWSPDGEWLAYSVSISLHREAIKLFRVTTRETFSVTNPVLRDIMPAFDPGGKYLYFLSYREYEPVYDTLQFDLGFPQGMKPYLVTLQAELPTPFILRPETIEEDQTVSENPPREKSTPDSDSEEKQEAESKEKGKQEIVPVKIELEGIEERVMAFPVDEGVYKQILGLGTGKVLYSRLPEQRASLDDQTEKSRTRCALFVYNFEDQKEELFQQDITDFAVSQDLKWVGYRSEDRLRVVKADVKPENGSLSPSRKTGWIDLRRMKVSLVPGAEWRQMFREAWRLQRDQFWTPDMSQVDWVVIHDRYLPLVDRVSSRLEFSDLMWEMQGELGTSHAYEFGGDYRSEPLYSQGFLGADFSYDEEVEAWKITHIYQGDEWDPKADSPLHQPGVNVQIGDYLLEINGQKLTISQSPSMKLVNLAGEEVMLKILPAQSTHQGEPNLAAARIITVKTLKSEFKVRYREWVDRNRAYVHQLSEGRIGYLHIPDMGTWGYAEFHRGYLAEIDHEALLVDLRFNRGGHVSSLLLEKLARRRIGYDLSRWGQLPYPYPPESVLGPMAALTNEFAGSDGDIFSHGFKLMKLGKLIGKRTWGGVIGISPRHLLVDGTLTTQPEYSFWFKDVGWGVENYGTDPDIEVDISPEDYVISRDPQLDKAIKVLMDELQAEPPEVPDLSIRPSWGLPKLPKKP